MDTSPAFAGLDCVDCGERFDPETATHRCPECGGILDPAYELGSLDLSQDDIESRPFDSIWRYDDLLPFPRSAAVTMGEGGTPLVDCPRLADELGVGRVVFKDEGQNPTGTFKDRGHSAALSAAVGHGAEEIALPSAGNAGQAGAAYAARAGLPAHVFLPSRAGFTMKAMVNVHGGDLTVVEGGIGDAGAACTEALAEHPEWYSTATFQTPYRHEGKKTMLFEIVEQLDWEVPDAVVYPTGGGVGLVGMHKAAMEFKELGLIDTLPPMYAAQSTGCAPIVEAWETGKAVHEVWEHPDTICGGIEIPDPGASPLILEAMRESDGGAVATTDDEILEGAITVAQQEGLEMIPTAAAAASGTIKLAQEGEFGPDDTVVILNTGAGNKSADVLRSHLMSHGV